MTTPAKTAKPSPLPKAVSVEKTKEHVGGIKLSPPQALTLGVTGNCRKLGHRVAEYFADWQADGKRAAANEEFRKQLKDDLQVSRDKGGKYYGRFVWDITYDIQRDNIAENAFLEKMKAWSESLAKIELMTQTTHGLEALAYARMGYTRVNTLYQEVAAKYANVFALWGGEYNYLFNEVAQESGKNSKREAPDKLVIEVLALKDLFDRCHAEMIAALEEAKTGLTEALTWESIKAWVKAHPDQADAALDAAQKSVDAATAAADSIKDKLVISGSTKEVIGLGTALTDSLSLRIFRQLRAANAASRTDAIMKNKALATQTLKKLSLEPTAVAEYLKGKYEATLEQLLADFSLGVQAIKTTVVLAVDAASHGASSALTALIGSIIDAIVNVLKKAIKTFLMTIQDKRIEAAKEELEKLKQKKGEAGSISPDEAKKLAKDQAKDSQNALDKFLTSAETFGKEIIAKISGEETDDLGARIQKTAKSAAKGQEAVEYLLKIFHVDDLDKADIPSIVEFFVTPVINAGIKEALTQVKVMPAQIFTYETYQEAILEMPVREAA